MYEYIYFILLVLFTCIFIVVYLFMLFFSIVSPMCLRTCFVEAISIPQNYSPIYTMAMRNVVLSISNLSPSEKVNNFSLYIFKFDFHCNL